MVAESAENIKKKHFLYTCARTKVKNLTFTRNLYFITLRLVKKLNPYLSYNHTHTGISRLYKNCNKQWQMSSFVFQYQNEYVCIVLSCTAYLSSQGKNSPKHRGVQWTLQHLSNIFSLVKDPGTVTEKKKDSIKRCGISVRYYYES